MYKKTDAVLYGTAKTITPGVNTCGGDLNTEFSYDVLYTVKDQFTTVTYIDYVSTAMLWRMWNSFSRFLYASLVN